MSSAKHSPVWLWLLGLALVGSACATSVNMQPTPTVALILPTVYQESATPTLPVIPAPIGETVVPAFTEAPAATMLPQAPASTSMAEGPLGKIVFVCQPTQTDAHDQICLINADGSGYQRITTDDDGDFNYPSFAPDGQSIIYAGKQGEGFEIFEMGLAGKAHQLTDDLGKAIAPEISPDNRAIVFTNKSGGHQTIWVMDRDGGNPHQVFGPPLGDGWDPVWSPDGRQILFASNHNGGIQLFVIDADGANLRQVTEMSGLRGRSDWSPDGNTIATYAGNEWHHELYLFDLRDVEPLQITDGGNNLAPSFSPNGKWIAFTSYIDDYGDPNGCEIYIMQLESGQITRLTDNEYCDWQPRWGW